MITRQPEVYLSNALGRLLEEWKTKLSPLEYNRAMRHVSANFDMVKTEINRHKPGKERAKAAHKALQDLINTEKKMVADFDLKVSCRSGCSGCCHQRVEINSDEADLMASLVRNGTKIDMEKLERQGTRDFDDLEWWRQPAKEKACLFLGEDNKCRIYNNRPMACRKYFTFTPPEKCSEVSATGSITVGVYTIPDAEIVASAVMSTVRGEGTIPNLLWERFKK